jgi:hypothetical protein
MVYDSGLSHLPSFYEQMPLWQSMAALQVSILQRLLPDYVMQPVG